MIAAAGIAEPFPGLRPFTPDEAALFFGRDEQIEELLQRLSSRRFLAVVGTSGSGKSSLVRAGLIPTIERGHLGPTGCRWVMAMVSRPGLDPLKGLAQALQASFTLPADEAAEVELGLARSSVGLTDFARSHLHRGERLLVFVDQFEELFRYRKQTGDDRRVKSTAFVKLLLSATGHGGLVPIDDEAPVYVVLTMRSDYLGKCAQFRGLPEALNDSQYLVPRMSRDQLRESIEGPIAMAGAGISENLVDRLLNDTGDDPDLLPVLQHALFRVWEQSKEARAKGLPLDLPHYEDESVRGMDQALNLDVEAAFKGLNGDERKEAIARRVFQRLVEPGSEDEESRRPTRFSELVGVCRAPESEVRDVLEVFRKRGFVTLSNDADPLVDIPHESLIRQWDRLKKWVQEEAGSASVYRRLADAAIHKRARYQGPDLAEALRWEQTQGPNADWASRYVDDPASFGEAIRFLRRSQLRQKIWRILGLALFVAAVSVAVFIFILYRKAGEQTRLADSRRLAATAQLIRENNPDRALLLDIEAYKAADTFEARNVLLGGLQHNPELLTYLYNRFPVTGIAFSPDGKTLAASSADKTVRLWNLATRQPLGSPLQGHAGILYAVTFSPDGKLLASGSEDQTVRLWNVAARRPVGPPLKGHTGSVTSVAFSPDGKMLASASWDKTVRLWDVATGQPLGAPLLGHSGIVFSVAFNRDGKLLASASEDHTVRLWDVASRQPVGSPLKGHLDSVTSVAFSPDGKMLASASWDKTVRLWDVAKGQPVGAPLLGHTDLVLSVAFSPDGKMLASTGWDKTVRLWDVATGQPSGSPLKGHSNVIFSAQFSPNGRRLASASEDGTVRLWNITASQSVVPPLQGQTGVITSIAFSPDGKMLASASYDKTVWLWDAATRQPLGAPLHGHLGPVTSVAFSPDGKMLASASWDKTLRLWDVATRQPLGLPLEGHTDSVYSVAFSPDGKMLASAGVDKTVRLWDVAARKPITSLQGHTDAVQSVTFSPNGKILASASYDRTVRLWDLSTHSPVGAPLQGHTGYVIHAAFSSDGKILASAGADGTVWLWDVATRQPLGSRLQKSTEAERSVAFSPDNKVLASASSDGTVHLWDVATHQLLGAPLQGHTGSVMSVAFSPDGRILASAGADRTVRLWDGGPQAWIDHTCAIVNRNLSSEEWKQYIGADAPYRKTCPL